MHRYEESDVTLTEVTEMEQAVRDWLLRCVIGPREVMTRNSDGIAFSAVLSSLLTTTAVTV